MPLAWGRQLAKASRRLDESSRRGLDGRGNSQPGQRPMIHIIFELIRAILGLISVVLIVHVVISWLFAFDIVSRRNEVVNSIWRFTSAITEPMLRPLRRLIPPIAGVDLSVMVLLLGIYLLQHEVSWWLERLLRGEGSLL